jgi:hypothetical protein
MRVPAVHVPLPSSTNPFGPSLLLPAAASMKTPMSDVVSAAFNPPPFLQTQRVCAHAGGA